MTEPGRDEGGLEEEGVAVLARRDPPEGRAASAVLDLLVVAQLVFLALIAWGAAAGVHETGVAEYPAGPFVMSASGAQLMGLWMAWTLFLAAAAVEFYRRHFMPRVLVLRPRRRKYVPSKGLSRWSLR